MPSVQSQTFAWFLVSSYTQTVSRFDLYEVEMLHKHKIKLFANFFIVIIWTLLLLINAVFQVVEMSDII